VNQVVNTDPDLLQPVLTEVRRWAQREKVATQRAWPSSKALAEGIGLWGAGSLVGTRIGGWVGLLIGWTLIFAALIRLQYLFHESAHRALFKQRWANDLLGAVLGSIAMVPHAAYRARHLEHHANTRVATDYRHDPEGFYDEVHSRLHYLFTIAFGGAYYATSHAWLVIRSTVRSTASTTPSARPYRGVHTWGLLSMLGSPCLIFTLIATGQSNEMVKWWLLPVGIFLSSMFTTMGFFEHHGVARNTPIVFASATVRSNGVFRWLALNALYHRAHHVLPNTPFYRLPDVEHEIVQSLQRHGVSDSAPHHTGVITFHRGLWAQLPWTAPADARRHTPDVAAQE
jgi:fatty acid desaturase